MPHNFKLTIAYDGSAYSGWQIQPNGITIQEIIQQKINTILQTEITLIGSGRTDAGVHALGQIAHFYAPHPINLYRFQGSLNSLLPTDIRIKNISEAPLEFHAQHSAISKIYHYNLHLDRVQDPFKRLYSLHIKEKINIPTLKEAAKLFLGTHDFTSFANERHLGSASKNPIRTLQRLDVIEQDGGVRLEFEADGFLYKMVRNIVGTLLEIASGKRLVKDVNRIFHSKDRRKAGGAAPPHGLFLICVSYPDNFSFDIQPKDGK